MAEVKNEEGEKCEVCASSSFVSKFCEAMGGDKECRELTERAGRGEISGEKYFEMVMSKYGKDKVDAAMEKALAINDAVTPPQQPQQTQPEQKTVSTEVSNKEGIDSTGEHPIPVSTHSVPDKKVIAPTMSEQKEVADINARLKRQTAKYRTSLKGLCIPCMGEPTIATLNVVKLWFAGAERASVEREIEAIRTGAKTIEDGLKEVMKMKGGHDNITKVLEDFNKLLELATDIALEEMPSLAKEVKE